MTLKELLNRCANGEICPVDTINGIPAPEFVDRNKKHFGHLTVQDEWDNVGLLWIFDHNVRASHEFNPKGVGCAVS